MRIYSNVLFGTGFNDGMPRTTTRFRSSIVGYELYCFVNDKFIPRSCRSIFGTGSLLTLLEGDTSFFSIEKRGNAEHQLHLGEWQFEVHAQVLFE